MQKDEDLKTDAARDADLAERLQRARAAGQTALNESDAKQMLRAFNITVPRGGVVDAGLTLDDLSSSINALEAPYVLKALADEAIHKSDIGAVQLGLGDAAAVASAMTTMGERLAAHGIESTGFLVEETAPAGLELIIGGQYDERFGSILMVGIGGIFVEIFKDVAYRICPIERRDADAMLDALQGAALFEGARGRPALPREAIVDAMMQLGGPDGLFTRLGGTVAEFDINPLIVSQSGAVAADARVVLAPAGEVTAPASPGDAPTQDFTRLFEPRTIAVAGASATGTSPGNRYIRALEAYGFDGEIFPVHPTAATVEGRTAYPSLDAVPKEIDFAHIAVAAPRVGDVLAAARGNVRFAQVITSGFSEATGDDTAEAELVAIAKAGDMRLLGPNCMGTHSPRGRATFMRGVTAQAGAVGIVSQSGGIGMDVLTRGEALGLRFSGVVTNGNSIDVAPHELLAHFLDDEDTRVIGLYLEDIKHGRAFLEALKRNALAKPVVLMTGGLTSAGRKAAGSHTGALTSEAHVWQALADQTGTHLVTDLDRFLDALLIHQTLAPRTAGATRSVVLFGNGGGTSVLGSDHIARADFAMATVPETVRARLDAIGIPDWVALANPIDVPAVQLKENDGGTAGAIVAAVLDEVRPDALIMHVNLAVILGYRDIPDLLDKLIASVLAACRRSEATHLVLVLRSDGSRECDEARRNIRETVAAEGIPVFDEVSRAAVALRALADFEAARAMRG